MQNKIKDIGVINGPLLVFGGVYSNLQALESLMKIAAEQKIPASNIICTGDIVAYCAEPEACVQAIRDWGIHCVVGNVELQLINKEADCGCNFEESTRCDLFSKNWYPYAQQQLSEEAIKWLATLPEFLTFDYAQKRCFVLHGGYENTSEFIFKSTPWAQKAAAFKKTKTDIILGGHCGIPFYDNQHELYWLNAGVIGMPANNGSTDVWYLTLTDKNDQFGFEFKNFSYDFQKAATLMKQEGLPQAYAKTLCTGIWDNCDILPKTETEQQGQALFGSMPAML